MPHMLSLAHKIVVLRHGRVVESFDAGAADIPTVVAAMLGSSQVAANGQ
jgi:ABC-type sugar transport system ATPase subunit